MKQIRWGIYAWYHMPTLRTYVGQTGPTKGFNRRRLDHLSDLRRDVHPSPRFQNAWNKHGEAEFAFVWLEDMTGTCAGMSKKEIAAVLTPREQFWMDGTESVFNAAPAAGSSLGIIRSPESCERIGEAVRKLWEDPEYRSLMCEAQSGTPRSPEHRANMSAGQKRRPPPSAETLLKMSVAQSGHAVAPETCSKISESVSVVWEDPEYRARMSVAHLGQIAWNKGIPQSPEAKAKNAAAHRGKTATPENLAKRSESLRKSWAARKAATAS